MRRLFGILMTLAMLASAPTAQAANSTVAAMTAAGALTGVELFYVVQGGADRKATPAQINTYVLSLMGTGIATWLGTPSSANLAAAVTDETGSGALVFATSPVLVTPALGTPSSGTLTNTTGFPLASLAGAGTGVLTAAAANLSAAGGLTTTIGSGTAALGTSAIGSAACATAVTVAATNVATTDVVTASFNSDPTAVTGYIPLTAGMLTIMVYPTSGNVNFKVCNNTSSSITPGAITLNWRVTR